MSDSREAILGRVRLALTRPAPTPHWEHEPRDSGPVFPVPAADDEPGLRERFRKEFEAIQGEFFEASSLEEAKNFLAKWIHEQEIRTAIAPAGGPNVTPDRGLEAVLSDLSIVQWVRTPGESKQGWDDIDVGFTLAESLVAESGTIAVSAASGGRALSVLPPIHFVVATADQLVPDLETSMRRFRDRYPKLPSSMSWISGPSRTADIEKILVLGAHGPRRLVLLLLPAGTL